MDEEGPEKEREYGVVWLLVSCECGCWLLRNSLLLEELYEVGGGLKRRRN